MCFNFLQNYTVIINLYLYITIIVYMFASKNKDFIRTRITLFSLLQSEVVMGKAWYNLVCGCGNSSSNPQGTAITLAIALRVTTSDMNKVRTFSAQILVLRQLQAIATIILICAFCAFLTKYNGQFLSG